jgi:pimeloyl-ACP methyl ester carboxylesterase
VVFLHGGAQNAHTFDTVILGLAEPALAIDLPGHGHSAWRDDGDYSPQRNADALTPVLRELAPAAELVVGMSLGGLTAIRLAATAPELVRRLALVDVTPSALQRHSQMSVADRGTVALAQGDRTFPDFASMLALTTMAAPHRDPESLRRGLLHNSQRLPDGRWTWRYDTIRSVGDFTELWSDVSAVAAPTTLIRGGDSGFVSADDIAEYARRSPGLTTHVVAGSGHSVQSDQPRALVELLRRTLP